MSTNQIDEKPEIEIGEKGQKDYYFLFVNRKSGSKAGN